MYIFIVGPTCSGKSALAVKIAKEINGEIIGADSMQIYKYMDIGTAKTPIAEREGVIHHMIDIIEPDENFSVAEYAARAEAVAADIEKRGKVPIICGGTGLYVNALLYGYEMRSYDPQLREKLKSELDKEGIDAFYKRLTELDPLAVQIHKNNVKRVLRAMEVILSDGKSILEQKDKQDAPRPHLMYALEWERTQLYDKINYRVEEMFDNGLKEEIDFLLDGKTDFGSQSMQAIGYKEFYDFYYNGLPLEIVKENIKKHTRNYAKRQLTWFKSIQSCKWVNIERFPAIIENIKHDYYKFTSNL